MKISKKQIDVVHDHFRTFFTRRENQAGKVIEFHAIARPYDRALLNGSHTVEYLMPISYEEFMRSLYNLVQEHKAKR